MMSYTKMQWKGSCKSLGQPESNYSDIKILFMSLRAGQDSSPNAAPSYSSVSQEACMALAGRTILGSPLVTYPVLTLNSIGVTSHVIWSFSYLKSASCWSCQEHQPMQSSFCWVGGASWVITTSPFHYSPLFSFLCSWNENSKAQAAVCAICLAESHRLHSVVCHFNNHTYSVRIWG